MKESEIVQSDPFDSDISEITDTNVADATRADSDRSEKTERLLIRA